VGLAVLEVGAHTTIKLVVRQLLGKAMLAEMALVVV
jgi:hypothetical protein